MFHRFVIMTNFSSSKLLSCVWTGQKRTGCTRRAEMSGPKGGQQELWGKMRQGRWGGEGGLALKATVTDGFLRHRRGTGNVVNAQMNCNAKQLRETLQLLRSGWT